MAIQVDGSGMAVMVKVVADPLPVESRAPEVLARVLVVTCAYACGRAKMSIAVATANNRAKLIDRSLVFIVCFKSWRLSTIRRQKSRKRSNWRA